MRRGGYGIKHKQRRLWDKIKTKNIRTKGSGAFLYAFGPSYFVYLFLFGNTLVISIRTKQWG